MFGGVLVPSVSKQPLDGIELVSKLVKEQEMGVDYKITTLLPAYYEKASKRKANEHLASKHVTNAFQFYLEPLAKTRV